jgi:hypothetical protein
MLVSIMFIFTDLCLGILKLTFGCFQFRDDAVGVRFNTMEL